MTLRPDSRHGNRGSALLAAVILMTVLGIVGSAYWSHLHATLRQARHEANAEAAFHLAEAGVAHGVAALRAGAPTPDALGNVPLGAGRYSTTISVGSEGNYLVRGVGELVEGDVVRARRVLVADLKLGTGGQVISYSMRLEWR